jgi:hypothetical protein
MKIARLKFEAKEGNFMLSKLIDMETGIVIPIRSIKIDMSIKNYQDGIVATVEIPIEMLDIENMQTELINYSELNEEK